MKNLAGNDADIFLFRYVLGKNAINFVLNESIAEDMYPEINEQIEPVAKACGATLLRYREKCFGDTIMDSHILVDGHLELMLSKGLGRHFDEKEKENLFDDAHKISKLLLEVIDRRSKEMEQGVYPGPQAVIPKIQRTGGADKSLEILGRKKRVLDELQLRLHTSDMTRLERLSPDELPCGVNARISYDHRGHCIAFDHESLGELGRIILVGQDDNKMLMHVEVSTLNSVTLADRQEVLEEIISMISSRFT